MRDEAFAIGDGVSIPSAGLWLDPHAARPLAVVSHAHSDHVRRHARTICTPATADLIRLRYGGADLRALPFHAPLRVGPARLTLYPAGHVLGSAQALVEAGGRRLLYSGDLRLRPSATTERAVVPEADLLVMETTFGRPRYVFPPEERVVSQIVAFCEQGFATRQTPVLFAYSLGKAQEVIALLQRHGLPTLVHPAIQAINAVYARHGVQLPECAGWDAPADDRTVIVCPPQSRKNRLFGDERRFRFAMLSGWAMDSGARFRYRCDEAFPLSDHCGYDDLLRYVELSRARMVYTLHGFAPEFAQDLRRRGIEAFPSGQAMQLPLPGIA
ncbi:MAG TPA: MBL fold metallo-hydrolase [Dehalococcoidia bacterium]|nr:MBL fold metallo-hydrolase [Dehalococcoidia bacterium]